MENKLGTKTNISDIKVLTLIFIVPLIILAFNKLGAIPSWFADFLPPLWLFVTGVVSLFRRNHLATIASGVLGVFIYGVFTSNGIYLLLNYISNLGSIGLYLFFGLIVPLIIFLGYLVLGSLTTAKNEYD